MDICLCADKNYLKFIIPLLESISKYHNSGCIFHIITDFVPEDEFRSKLKNIINENELIIHIIDNDEFRDMKETAHFTKAMYYRFKIPELIHKSWVLYLDCDMLVLGNISKLFESLETGAPLYAVRNPFFNRQKALNFNSNRYFNSGLMLINCDWWRENFVYDRLLELLKNSSNNFNYPDQDALNIVYENIWSELSPSFNVQFSILKRPKSAFSESNRFQEALDNPLVIHFSTPNKQWHYSCYNPYIKNYLSLQSSIRVYRFNFFKDLAAKYKGWFLYKFYNFID